MINFRKLGAYEGSVDLLVTPRKYQIYYELKQAELGVLIKTARFTETAVSLAQKAAAGDPELAYRPD